LFGIERGSDLLDQLFDGGSQVADFVAEAGDVFDALANSLELRR
jgi:hypothetical protein